MKNQPDLSVVISVYNDAENLDECLKSLKNLDVEVIVVNNSSLDNTQEIAKKYTQNVYAQKNDPLKIDLQKNFGFQKATKSWILSLDADERLTPGLISEIKELVESNNLDINGYLIPRKNIIFGKWIQNSIWSPDYQLRLFRKGKGKFTESSVHRSLTITGVTEKLTEPIVHINYTSISQYLSKMDKIYTEIEAEQLVKSGKDLTWVDAIRFPVNDFLKTFFLQKGYKDGLHGLVLSILQAFYMEIVFAKAWEKKGFYEENDPKFLQKLTAEFKKIGSEFRYWFLTSRIESEKNLVKKIAFKVKRKF